MKTIKLPCFEMVLELGDKGGGSIVSDLHDDRAMDTPAHNLYNACMDMVESMVLAHACAGIKVDSPEYVEGLELSVQSLINNYE